jgi:hypothetical protein
MVINKTELYKMGQGSKRSTQIQLLLRKLAMNFVTEVTPYLLLHHNKQCLSLPP